MSAHISWIENKHQGNMQYLENNIEKRFQPDLLNKRIIQNLTFLTIRDHSLEEKLGQIP